MTASSAVPRCWPIICRIFILYLLKRFTAVLHPVSVSVLCNSLHSQGHLGLLVGMCGHLSGAMGRKGALPALYFCSEESSVDRDQPQMHLALFEL